MIGDVVEVDTSRNGNRTNKVLHGPYKNRNYNIAQGALVQSHLPGDHQSMFLMLVPKIVALGT